MTQLGLHDEPPKLRCPGTPKERPGRRAHSAVAAAVVATRHRRLDNFRRRRLFDYSGAELRNSVFLGLAAWHSASESLSLGAEIFHATPDRPGAARLTGFNLGAIYELGNERRHRLLVSAGAGILKRGATDRATLFLGYQVTP